MSRTLQERQCVGWACGTLRLAGWFFDTNSEGGWDIETPSGWVVANTIPELCAVARKATGYLDRS